MDYHTHATPMDFSYDNGTGPLDMSSPFANLGRNQIDNDKKYKYAAFARSTSPTISDPASKQKDVFSSLLPSASESSSFIAFERLTSPQHTPRRLYSDTHESSERESLRSSQHAQGLNDDAVLRNHNMDFKNHSALDDKNWMNLNHGGKTVAFPSSENRQKNNRRSSWWRTMQMKVNKPTDGSPRYIRNNYSHRAQRKALNWLNEELELLDLAQQTSLSASSEEMRDARRPAKSSRTVQQQQPTEPNALQKQQQDPHQHRLHWLCTLLDSINKYPTLPNVLYLWAQFLLNSFIIASMTYILYSFWSTIRSDVDKKASEAVADLLAEMSLCAKYYTSSNCTRNQAPAIQSLCQNWERCMNQDPQHLGRAKLSAHTLAEIINAFIEPISYKAIIVSMALIIVLFTVPNLAFSRFREKTYQQQHNHYYRSGYEPPKTPHKESSEQHLEWSPY